MTNIYHPAPINQFYRLDKDTPSSPYVKTTRWNHVHAGVNFDGFLCMCAEGAVALDAHTQGQYRTSPGYLHDRQDDRSGGIGVDDVAVAWKRGWNQTLLTPDNYDWADTMYAVKVQRRHVLVGVDYDYVPEQYQVQKTGSFDHAIGIDDFRVSDSRVLRYDSLDTKAIWTPQSAYREAAERLALRVRGTRARLFVGLTAPRPLLGTGWHAVVRPVDGDFVRYFVSGIGSSRRIVDYEQVQTNGFDAPCTAPQMILRKTVNVRVPLVQIINPGKFNHGMWISDDWARSK